VIRATSPTVGHGDGMPGFRPYRWRGKPMPVPVPVPAERPENSWVPGSREERLEALAVMYMNRVAGVNADRLPRGILSYEQAARKLNVSTRTIARDLRALREMADAS
jgi:hypothetical protein